MSKQFKRFEAKSVSEYQDKSSGEMKKKYNNFGTITLFSDSPIPEDMSIKLEMALLPNLVNPIAVFEQKPYDDKNKKAFS
jgi:hypothetical protein